MRVLLPLLVVALVALTVVFFVLPDSEPPETPDAVPSPPTTPAAPVNAPEDGPESPRTDIPSPPDAPPPSATADTRPDAAAPAEESKSSVWGVVKTEAGAPIEGATVRLMSFRGFGAGRETTVDREAASDPGGRFRFADLPDEKNARFTVAASHPSYYTIRVMKWGYGACTLTLGPPGVVHGRVVYEDTDEPCAGTTVQLLNVQGGNGRAETDENGAYRIGALQPGTYRAMLGSGRRLLPQENVTVEANIETEANFRMKRSVAVHGIVQDAASEAPVGGAVIKSWIGGESIAVGPDGRFTLPEAGLGRFRVSAPGYVAKTLQLRNLAGTSPARPHVVRLERGAVIEGVLIKEDGALPEKVRVIVEKEDERRNVFFRPGDSAEVDKDGRFRIEGAPAGVPVRVVAVQVLRRLAESAPLTLSAGETRRDVRLTLAATGSIAGRVTGPDDAPVGGATVTIQLSGEGFPVPIARQTTGADGRYTLERVPPGRHTIRVSAKEFARASRDYTLASPERITGVDFRLDTGLAITGLVRDTNGNPVAKASVTAIPANGMADGLNGATTDDSGRFVVKNLTAGTYGIYCSSRDHFPIEGNRAEYAKAGDAGVVLVLEALSGPVTGVVRDRATGAPVPRFSVRMLGHRSFAQKFSDGEGRFRLRGGPAGRQALLATTEDGRVSEIVTVELTSGGSPPPIELWVAPGASIVGRVLAPDGSPLGRARVEVVRSAPPRGTVGRATTDRDGRFRCTGLRRERVVVRASHPEWIEVEQEVTPGDDPTKVELRLVADGGTVTVTVVDSAGKPVAAVPVRFVRDGRLIRPNTLKEKLPRGKNLLEARRGLYRTDENGRHVRRFLPRGRYTIEVSVPEGRGSIAVDVEAGAAKSVTLRLAPQKRDGYRNSPAPETPN